MNERCPCLEEPEFFDDGTICRTCPWRLVSAVLSGRGVAMPRKDYIAYVVAALDGEAATEVVQAIVDNYCVEPRVAKRALQRTVKEWKRRKLSEKR